jgi:hypothetical protein
MVVVVGQKRLPWRRGDIGQPFGSEFFQHIGCKHGAVVSAPDCGTGSMKLSAEGVASTILLVVGFSMRVGGSADMLKIAFD